MASAGESKAKASGAAKTPYKPRAIKPVAVVEAPKTPDMTIDAVQETPAPVVPAVEPVPEPQSSAPHASETLSHDGKRIIIMKPPVVLRDLAEKMGVKFYQITHDLMEMNIFKTQNDTIEWDIARKLCEKRSLVLEQEKQKPVEPPPKKIEEPPPVIHVEKNDDPTPLRAPVVTFMGHVDHGKTSLLDAIRRARVAAGEAGGITQHIGAYQVEHNGQKITFLDTPGHAAFSAMRARGANMTDIVVLVVAADDGIMPQTEEALAHAKAAGVKIMVAINKIDLPSIDLNRVKKQLQDHGLVPEEWGGETIVSEVSATKKIGIDRLLENIQVLAEVMELKADPEGPAKATVVEAQLEQGRGPTVTLLVQSGTLKIGAAFICGDYYGKVKSMFSDSDKPIKSAGPSTPAKILGLTGVPLAGDALVEMTSEKDARTLSEERQQQLRLGKLQGQKRVTLENLFETLADENKKALKLILKADVQGSVEAIADSLAKILHDKVGVEILLKGVGPITESDVMLAAASNAVVIGFNSRTENVAAAAAKRENIQIKLFSIIYELIDQVREAMAGLLDPVTRESVIGHAVCKQVIELSKFPIAGCAVQSGRITKSGRARILRGRQEIYDGSIVTLKRFQDEVNEVRSGLECGVRLGNFSEYLVGDIIECYQLEKVPQQF